MSSDPGCRPTPLLCHTVAGDPHIKWRKIGTDVSSGKIFLRTKKLDKVREKTFRYKYLSIYIPQLFKFLPNDSLNVI